MNSRSQSSGVPEAAWLCYVFSIAWTLGSCRPGSGWRCSCYLHGCPCGFYGDTTRECRCTPAIISRYLGKISGPLLDRIDLHVEVPAVPYKEMRADEQGVSSAEMRARIERTRLIQHQRGHTNAHLPTKLLRKLCRLDEAGERTLEMTMRRLALSARAHSPLSKSPAPSPTSTNPKPSPPNTSPRRYSTGASIGATGADGKHHDHHLQREIRSPVYRV